MREVRIVDCEVVTLERVLPGNLCRHCGSDVSICGEQLCQVRKQEISPAAPECGRAEVRDA